MCEHYTRIKCKEKKTNKNKAFFLKNIWRLNKNVVYL